MFKGPENHFMEESKLVETNKTKFLELERKVKTYHMF